MGAVTAAPVIAVTPDWLRVARRIAEVPAAGDRMLAIGAEEDIETLDIALDLDDDVVVDPGLTAVGNAWVGRIVGTIHIGESLIIVLRIHQDGKPYLLEVRDATGLARLFARLGEDRKQNGSQNRDDCNYHKEFNERETLSQAKWALHMTPFSFLRAH